MKRRVFLGGTVALITAPLHAQHKPAYTALAGNRFQIGAIEYQLADIVAPPAYTLDGDRAPYFDEARASLSRVLENAPFEIAEMHQTTRWRAQIIYAHRPDGGASLQELLIAAGAARVAPHTDKNDIIEKLLALEAEARGARKGLWSLNTYAIVDATHAEGAIGAFHLVEGVVLRAHKTRSRFYLNFGEDYRTDFTASVKSSLYRKWASDGDDLASFEGVRVRMRGFVKSINGPSIELTHRKQIEILAS